MDHASTMDHRVVKIHVAGTRFQFVTVGLSTLPLENLWVKVRISGHRTGNKG